MRFIARGAAIGLLVGAAFFFVPFLLRFFLFFLLISIIVRLAIGRGWRRRQYRPGYYNRHFQDQHDVYGNNIISIDGRNFVPPVHNNGNESRFPVL